MRHRKTRRFRRRSNDRIHSMRGNPTDKVGLGNHTFNNGRGRNGFKQHQSAEKLAEKYNALGKEALSSGDRVLSENYFQYADHFMRIIKEKSLNKNLNDFSSNQETVIPKSEISTTSSTDKQETIVKEETKK